jgi:serine/threonine protein kinase
MVKHLLPLILVDKACLSYESGLPNVHQTAPTALYNLQNLDGGSKIEYVTSIQDPTITAELRFIHKDNSTAFQSQLHILRTLHHPNLMLVQDIFDWNENIYFVSECVQLSLKELVERTKLNEHQLATILKQVSGGYFALSEANNPASCLSRIS